MAKVLFR